MQELNLVAPIISSEQLQQVARDFSVGRFFRRDSRREFCFLYAFRACERGEWELVDLNASPLSLLVDSVGRTLLLKAIIQQRDDVVAGLVDRGIGIVTKDNCDKTILDYLAFKAGGERSSLYAESVRKKLKELCTSNSLKDLLVKEEKSALEYMHICNFLGNISSLSTSTEEGSKILRIKADKIDSLFESPLPIMLEYRKAISQFEERGPPPLLSGLFFQIITDQPQGGSYIDLRRRIYGLIPGVIEDFIEEQNVIEAIRAMGEPELDRFINKFQLFISSSDDYPEKDQDLKKMLSLVDLLMMSTDIKIELSKSKKIAELLLLVSENQHQFFRVLFANAYFSVAYSMLTQKNRNKQIIIDYFTRSIDLFNNSSSRDFITLSYCYYYRAEIYRETGNDSKAEADYRTLIETVDLIRGKGDYSIILIQSYFGLALILSGRKCFDEALVFARRAYLTIIDDGFKDGGGDVIKKNYYPAIVRVLKNIYLSLRNFDEALQYTKELVSFYEKQGSKDLEVQALFDLGYINFKIRKYADALDSFNKVIQFRHYLPQDLDRVFEDVLFRAQEALHIDAHQPSLSAGEC